MHTTNTICVGIHCFNEEKSIAYTINSILAQKGIADLEIIVCTNGCTDQTREIVQSLAANNPKIRLIRAPRGKPNAWNTIRRATSCQYIMFTDGDVILAENTLSLLLCKLKGTPHAIGVGSRVIQLFAPNNFLGLGALSPDPSPKYCSLHGAGYMIDNFKLSKLMAEKGLALMPPDIIHEDRWLTGFIGQKKIVVCSQAIVYQMEASSILEIINRYVRQSIGRYQIQKEYPEIAQISEPTLIEHALAKFATWAKMKKTGSKLLFPLAVASRFLIRTTCHWLGRYLYHKKLYSNHWHPASTTKNGERLNQLNQCIQSERL